MTHGPLFLGLTTALLLVACAAKTAREPTCPACPCNECEQAAAVGPAGPSGPTGTAGPAGPTGAADPSVSDEAVAELTASMSRKLAHRDGAGCLADLDKLAAARPQQARLLEMNRAYCEMLTGRCEQGKQRLGRVWREDQNMHPERAAKVTDAMAVQYCRGGDTSERDRLLTAIQALQMGSVETATLKECSDNYATVRELQGKVKPRDAEDHPLLSLKDTLYATAPGCFARAGDCARARAVFMENFPRERLAGVDAKVRDDAMRSTFEALVTRCK